MPSISITLGSAAKSGISAWANVRCAGALSLVNELAVEGRFDSIAFKHDADVVPAVAFDLAVHRLGQQSLRFDAMARVAPAADVPPALGVGVRCAEEDQEPLVPFELSCFETECVVAPGRIADRDHRAGHIAGLTQHTVDDGPFAAPGVPAIQPFGEVARVERLVALDDRDVFEFGLCFPRSDADHALNQLIRPRC
ncbi:MAG: hypothetical protein QM770_18510 [Tepidisphaeraceae bacterium]